MPPLIITATPNISWLHPQVDYPRTPQAIAEEARLCCENGAAILHTHAEGRWADPAEIAEPIYFLASEGASFVTGADWLVDCGWVAK